jgi:Ni,Fe-hydrogenase III large subunit
VKRAAWTPLDGAQFDPAHGERALAYVAPDSSFALYNDYRSGGSFLVRPWGRDGSEPWGARWAEADRTDGIHALGATDGVEGYGVFTFPYGPISLGVPEAGRFDLRSYGERILSASPVGGYKRRRILPGLLGLSVEDAALRIERIAGNFAAAHVSAFLSAVESARGEPVAIGELWIRAFAQEVQRVYNHLHVIARIAEAASQNVGLAQAHALAEELLRLQGDCFGHRWAFGGLLRGGPPVRLDREDRRVLPTRLGGLAARFEELWTLFLGSRTFVDRIQATAVVPRERAVATGAVGPTLRACGVAWDDRLRVPTVPYSDLFVDLPQESGGDALARVLVRADEIRSSFSLLEQLLDRWPKRPGEPVAPDEPIAPGRGLGRVEAPSGDLVYDVALREGRLAHVGVRTPSQANFPVFGESLRDAVFTDFHFAFESFGLVFAEADR